MSVTSRSHDELGALAESFNTMVGRLKNYHNMNIGRLLSEKRKNDAVISAIDDGVLLVDEEYRIANANPAAQTALSIHVDPEFPKHFLEQFNNPELFAFIRDSIDSGAAPLIPEERSVLSIPDGDNYRHYQFSLTPVTASGRNRSGRCSFFGM